MNEDVARKRHVGRHGGARERAIAAMANLREGATGAARYQIHLAECRDADGPGRADVAADRRIVTDLRESARGRAALQIYVVRKHGDGAAGTAHVHAGRPAQRIDEDRSEEHTSEL